MVERPIIFNDSMVRVILDGRKTQTRRPFTPPKWVRPDEVEEFVAALNKYGGACAKRGRCDGVRNYVGPLGKAGDRLWVREAHSEVHPCQAEGRYSKEGLAGISGPPPVPYRVIYRADGPMPAPVRHIDAFPYRELDASATKHLPGEGGAWTPSIHMPRWASRLTLEVESVRIERLHEITEEDAKAEGLKAMTKDGSLFKWGIPDRDGWPGRDDDGWHWHEWHRDPREAFARLWDGIYGTWAQNPLVWVATFKVEEVRRG